MQCNAIASNARTRATSQCKDQEVLSVNAITQYNAVLNRERRNHAVVSSWGVVRSRREVGLVCVVCGSDCGGVLVTPINMVMRRVCVVGSLFPGGYAEMTVSITFVSPLHAPLLPL